MTRTANQWKAEVDIRLGGAAHVLRLDLDQVAELEQRLNAPMSHLITSGGKGVALGFLREVIFESIETIGKTTKTRKGISRMMTDTLRDPDLGLEHIASKVTVLIGMAAFGKTREEMESRMMTEEDDEDEQVEAQGEDTSPLHGSNGSNETSSGSETMLSTGHSSLASDFKSG